MNILDKILIVAKYTLKEILKSKVLYITLVIGVALMIVTYVATEFTYGVPEKVSLDFGLGMLSLSSIGISIFMGATLLPNEIDSRTVYMVISRPVPRWVFITGKVVGLIGVLAVNFAILSAMTLAVLISWVVKSIRPLLWRFSSLFWNVFSCFSWWFSFLSLPIIFFPHPFLW